MEILFSTDHRHHGKGPVLFAWEPRAGTHVASTGTSRVVHIFAQRGELVDQVMPPAPSVCIGLSWNAEGTILAIMQAQSSIVVLWDLRSRSTQYLDMGSKDLSCMAWASTGCNLAVGTTRGELFITNTETEERITAESRHRKRITCAVWSNECRLAFASEDRHITVCDAGGITVDHFKVRLRPLSVAFGGNGDNDNIVSVNMEGCVIFLHDLLRDENAVELTFQENYGTIVAYTWVGESHILAGFTSGQIVMISTDAQEMYKEVHSSRIHHDGLRDLAYCSVTQRLATCTDSCISVVDQETWKIVAKFPLGKEQGRLDLSVAWGAQGRVLSASTKTGCLYNFDVYSERTVVPRAVSTSATAMVLQPLTPAAMLLMVVTILALLLALCVIGMGVPVTDALRAILGTSESL